LGLDKVWLWKRCGRGKATAKTKYRDLSTAAAKAPPTVEMTWFSGGEARSLTGEIYIVYT